MLDDTGKWAFPWDSCYNCIFLWVMLDDTRTFVFPWVMLSDTIRNALSLSLGDTTECKFCLVTQQHASFAWWHIYTYIFLSLVWCQSDMHLFFNLKPCLQKDNSVCCPVIKLGISFVLSDQSKHYGLDIVVTISVSIVTLVSIKTILES